MPYPARTRARALSPSLAPLSFLLMAVVALLMAAAGPAGADEADATQDGTEAAEEDGDAGLDAPAFDHFFEDTVGRSYDAAAFALATEGVILGCDTVLFCPEDEVTRGQLATMLVNALDLEPEAQGPFTDIDESVHAEQINAIAAQGITVGCQADAYCPSDTITREQFASLLVTAFALPASDVQHFDGLGDVHGDNVNRLAEAGITAGCTEPLTSYCGTEPVLRWHAASFLARAMQLIERVEIVPLEERRAEQERIEAEREAQRQAEEEARRAEQEALEAERAAADPWGISELSDDRIAMWERLAGCESNNDWTAVSANGLYYGGLQFHPDTWRSVGGTGMPNEASREEQIYRAERLLEQPWATFSNQWPACSEMLGLG